MYVPPVKGCTTHNFAPNGESLEGTQGNNILLWKAHIGDGFVLQLHIFKKTNAKFICLRRNQNVGACISPKYFESLCKALKTMGEECVELLKEED